MTALCRLSEEPQAYHGDEHDSGYTPGILHATLSIDADQLQEEAAREELVLDRKTFGGTGFHARRLPKAPVTRLRRQFERIHRGQSATAAAGIWRRTLFRAFADTLDDTPQTYVCWLPLHLIRSDLASEAEKACRTVRGGLRPATRRDS
ncbi:hypothetical protein MesoLjLc_58730 [Mesorhizobium sp. L-8-10]|nr:hypothetical protein MesoLjLc_58730 [Mesorhizobium sp. L-8-10]